jgi:hypothetical protein
MQRPKLVDRHGRSRSWCHPFRLCGWSRVQRWPSPFQPCPAVAAFYWVKSRAPVTPAGFSIGSFGRYKSDLLNGEGPINSLFSRDHSRLFAMRLTRQDCAADESGPSPRVPSDPFDNRVFRFLDIPSYWQNLWHVDFVPGPHPSRLSPQKKRPQPKGFQSARWSSLGLRREGGNDQWTRRSFARGISF